MEEGFSRRGLELRLAPPGDQEHSLACSKTSTNFTKHTFQEKDHDPSLLSLGNSYSTITTHSACSGSKRGLEKSWLNESQTQTHKFLYYDQQKDLDLLPGMKKESSQSKGLVSELHKTEKQQAFSPDASAVKNTAGPNTSHKRFILFSLLQVLFTAQVYYIVFLLYRAYSLYSDTIVLLHIACCIWT